MRSVALTVVIAAALTSLAAQQMPNLREMSGVPLPAQDLPPGTVSVRVVRGEFNNIDKQPVEFVVGTERRVVVTDAGGRAQISELKPGTKVKASTVVDGQRLETQEIEIGQTGIRFILAAADPEAAAPPVRGTVTFSPESRIIAQLGEDRLQIFYILDIVNSARTRVDIGGPVIIDLPRKARGASVMQGSSPQASVKGTRVTVIGPFAPGTTEVNVAFELPHDGPSVTLTQEWPIALPELTVLMPQTGGLALQSPQISASREVKQDGRPILMATGPPINAGGELSLEIDGLPHHARWPRRVALSLAGLILVAGFWGAIKAKRHA